MEAGPREGWYGDPSDPARLRWWDGAGWTEHTRERPAAAEEPTAEPEPAPPEAPSPAPEDADADEERKRREAAELLAMRMPASEPDPEDPTRRAIPWLIGGILLLLALGATAIFLNNSGEEDLPIISTPPIDQADATADADAQALAQEAQTAIESYANSNGGSYEGATPEDLARIAPRLSGAALTVDGNETNYSVSVESASGNAFTITRDDGGLTTLTCGDPATGACPASGFWG